MPQTEVEGDRRARAPGMSCVPDFAKPLPKLLAKTRPLAFLVFSGARRKAVYRAAKPSEHASEERRFIVRLQERTLGARNEIPAEMASIGCGVVAKK
jgi:hypothetical protein|tara:strand:- start:186 stop:476 length:291 start_codon:yes stop_codon:yes gene_type:complete